MGQRHLASVLTLDAWRGLNLEVSLLSLWLRLLVVPGSATTNVSWRFRNASKNRNLDSNFPAPLCVIPGESRPVAIYR